MPWEITVIFCNGSSYKYHFIIEKLAEEFEVQFTCLGENTKKHITFPVPVRKEFKRIGKSDKEILKTMPYKLKFINSTNVSMKKFIKINVNMGMIMKNAKYGKVNTKTI